MKESLIQSAIEAYLQYMENQGKLMVIKQNSGALRGINGGFVRFGRAGASDFIVIMPEGRTLWLEVKNEKGRQQDSQKDFEKKLCCLGHKYAIVRSVEETENLIKEELENGRAKRPDEADGRAVRKWAVADQEVAGRD